MIRDSGIELHAVMLEVARVFLALANPIASGRATCLTLNDSSFMRGCWKRRPFNKWCSSLACLLARMPQARDDCKPRSDSKGSMSPIQDPTKLTTVFACYMSRLRRAIRSRAQKLRPFACSPHERHYHTQYCDVHSKLLYISTSANV